MDVVRAWPHVDVWQRTLAQCGIEAAVNSGGSSLTRALRPALFRVSAETEAVLRNGRRHTPGFFCHTDSDLLARMLDEPAAAIVLDIGSRTTLHRGAIPNQVLNALAGRTVLVHTALTPGAARQLLAVAEKTAEWCVALDGYDDLCRHVDALICRRVEAPAYPAIVELVVPNVDASIRDIVVAAAIRGERRMLAASFAQACCLPLRTLQSRLRDGGAPPTNELLGCCLGLHACWRLEYLNWPSKRVADAAGFHGTAAFGGYLVRHGLARPRELRRSGSFSRLVTQFLEGFRQPSLPDSLSLRGL